MKRNQIILVNPKDQKIGTIEKLAGHRYGMLHRAFSVFIFRKRNGKIQTLLQRRSMKKYHGGGLWTNACCSHPHPGEKILASAHRRLYQEMGIQTALKEVGKFHYIAKMSDEMTENEIDHVFIGKIENDNIVFNKQEVDQCQWIDIKTLEKELKKDLNARKRKYTPWLRQALSIALKYASSIV